MPERLHIRLTEQIKKDMAQTVIPVPGRFRADEYGTPLAYTSDLYDTTAQKDQQQINAELYQSVSGIAPSASVSTCESIIDELT